MTGSHRVQQTMSQDLIQTYRERRDIGHFVHSIYYFVHSIYIQDRVYDVLGGDFAIKVILKGLMYLLPVDWGIRHIPLLASFWKFFRNKFERFVLFSITRLRDKVNLFIIKLLEVFCLPGVFIVVIEKLESFSNEFWEVSVLC